MHRTRPSSFRDSIIKTSLSSLRPELWLQWKYDFTFKFKDFRKALTKYSKLGKSLNLHDFVPLLMIQKLVLLFIKKNVA